MTELNQSNSDAADATLNPCLPELSDAESLLNELRKILVRSDKALIQGDARENVEKLERWIESYRRGLSAASKISKNGSEMLRSSRDQLNASLAELQRLEDEGGNTPPSKEKAQENDDLAHAIRRIDQLMVELENSFHKTPEAA